ncbi:hypothetical protein D3C73_1302020 [compost metagenome]
MGGHRPRYGAIVTTGDKEEALADGRGAIVTSGQLPPFDAIPNPPDQSGQFHLVQPEHRPHF